MKKTILTAVVAIAAVGAIFYILVTNTRRPSHIHFSTQGGVLKQAIYYSVTPPETADRHECDGNFTEMREDLYETHLRLWHEKYGGGQ